MPVKMSKIEQGIRLVIKFNELFNRHDVTAMMDLCSDDCRFESAAPAPDGITIIGEEAMAQFWQDFFHESPQAHMEMEDIFGLGKRCILHWLYEWVDAEGGKQHIRGVDIFRVKDGLINEILSYTKGR